MAEDKAFIFVYEQALRATHRAEIGFISAFTLKICENKHLFWVVVELFNKNITPTRLDKNRNTYKQQQTTNS